MTTTFKEGDIVRVTKDYQGALITGLLAKVLCVRAYGLHPVGLEFFDLFETTGFERGHSCAGLGRAGYCWNVPISYCELAEDANRSPIERKTRRLWNKSNFVAKHKQLAY